MTYRKENRPRCTVAHKSWFTLCRCVFPWADVMGEGPYCAVYDARPYRKVLFMLFPLREMAEQELQVGSGGRSLKILYPHPGCAAPDQAA